MQPCQWPEILLRAELGPGHAISWQASWEQALSKRDLVWARKSAGSLEPSAPCHVVGTVRKSLACWHSPWHPLCHQKRAWGCPWGCLMTPCTLPMLGMELLSFLSTISLTPGPIFLWKIPSAVAITRTDYNAQEVLPLPRLLISLPMVSLFTSHLCGSLLSVPYTWYPASGEEQGEIPYRSWAPDFVAQIGYPKNLCAGSWGWAVA